MSITARLSAALRQGGIAPGEGVDMTSGLRRGWDYWTPTAVAGATQSTGNPTLKPDTDGFGMIRAPHRHLLYNEALPGGTLPVLALDMDLNQLLAGIWRQCLIRPGDDNIPLSRNPWAVSEPDSLCMSSDYMIAPIGHPPRDLAHWYVELRHQNPALFRLVLAKDFRGAVDLAPDIISYPWPRSVSRIWQAGQDDYLPPFLVAVLYAEIARLAMNQTGLLALAFDGKIEMTSRRLLDRIAASGGAARCEPADRTFQEAPYQSLALIPPTALTQAGDHTATAAWIEATASELVRSIGEYGSIDITPESPNDARSVMGEFANHPQFAPEERKGKGSSIQPRGTAMFWGLNWRLNAAVRLLEIGDTAREWNVLHRPNGERLPDALKYRQPSQVARALAAIRFRWLAEFSCKAALPILGEVLTKEEKAQEGFTRWSEDMITPLTIDDCLGGKSGLEMLKKAREHMPLLPQRGQFGYTARSQAHLWLDDDGDDIAHYHHFQAEALRGQMLHRATTNLEAATGVPGNIADRLGRPHGIKQRHTDTATWPAHPRGIGMTTDPRAASGAQLWGASISPLSTDPILGRLIRKK